MLAAEGGPADKPEGSRRSLGPKGSSLAAVKLAAGSAASWIAPMGTGFSSTAAWHREAMPRSKPAKSGRSSLAAGIRRKRHGRAGDRTCWIPTLFLRAASRYGPNSRYRRLLAFPLSSTASVAGRYDVPNMTGQQWTCAAQRKVGGIRQVSPRAGRQAGRPSLRDSEATQIWPSPIFWCP